MNRPEPSRARRRLALAAVTGLVLASNFVATTATATQPTSGTAGTTPAVVTVDDRHNDVLKSGTEIKPRKGHLDIYWASARVDSDNIVVTVKVADLKASDTRDVGTGGWHTLASGLAVWLKWGTHRDSITYSTMTDSPDGEYWRNHECSEPEPDDVYDISGLDQDADYEGNTYSFTIPISCMPEDQTSIRVSAYTMWGGQHGGLPLYSDFVTPSIKSNRIKWSTSLTFR